MAAQTLKVLSYNIHKGFTTGNRKHVLEDIREAIRSVNPDFVFLQEVMGADLRRKDGSPVAASTMLAQFEFLADEIWHHFAYGKNAVYTDGHHGNAILSKYPITVWENIDVSNNKMEKRGILHAIAELPEGKIPVHLICMHLDLFEAGRQAQILKLADRIRSTIPHHECLIVGGDFNDWRESLGNILTHQVGLREVFHELHGAHARSFPSFFPLLKLDRIYYRNLRPKSAVCLTGQDWRNLSDHAAVLGEFATGTSYE